MLPTAGQNGRKYVSDEVMSISQRLELPMAEVELVVELWRLVHQLHCLLLEQLERASSHAI